MPTDKPFFWQDAKMEDKDKEREEDAPKDSRAKVSAGRFSSTSVYLT